MIVRQIEEKREKSCGKRKATHLFIFFALLHIVVVVSRRSGSKLIIGRIALIIIYAFGLFNWFIWFIWFVCFCLDEWMRVSGVDKRGGENRDDYYDAVFDGKEWKGWKRREYRSAGTLFWH